MCTLSRVHCSNQTLQTLGRPHVVSYQLCFNLQIHKYTLSKFEKRDYFLLPVFFHYIDFYVAWTLIQGPSKVQQDEYRSIHFKCDNCSPKVKSDET